MSPLEAQKMMEEMKRMACWKQVEVWESTNDGYGVLAIDAQDGSVWLYTERTGFLRKM